MDAASMIAYCKSITALLLALTSLNLITHKWPNHVPVEGDAVYDYIVVGAGTAGSVVANRLSEDQNVTVLLVEAGGDPSWESQYPMLFPYLTKTVMDWNFTSEDDHYSAQYHRNKCLDLPAGKVLGGSSTLDHFYVLRGDPYDFQRWAEAANDDSWNWWNLLPYFKKSERMEDEHIINSDTASFHGMDGLVGITKDAHTLSLKYLEALGEMGHKIRDDLTTNDTLGFARPLLTVGKNGIRQSSAECFLATAKNRPNFHVMKNSLVTRVLIQGDKAVGVECSTPDGLINIYARKETIITAGAFNTPKILMLSGVGPKEHLESVGIPVVYDSPEVGQNLQDHLAVPLILLSEYSDDPVEAQPLSNFPVSTFVGSGTSNKGQDYPDWMVLALICRNNPSVMLQLSSIVLGMHDDVSNQIAAAAKGREAVFMVINVAQPNSTGWVGLRSSNPQDSPKIYTGHLSNPTDLENNAKWIQEIIKLTNTTYFKSVGGETLYIDLPNCRGLDRDTTEYWKCYVLNMMDTTFHYTSTCRMGSVLDSRLRVIGIQQLRVGDASAMPNLVSAKINTAVRAVAEKCADMIKEDNRE